MIIGLGNLGSAITDRKGALFFCSGVSNSSCTDLYEFKRERDTFLRYVHLHHCCFYFSSIAAAYSDTLYFRHKREMERMVSDYFDNYNIIRIGNIDWDDNPNTFLNYLRAKIAKGEQVEIKDEYRYMISKQSLLNITDNIPLLGKNFINVFDRMDKVKNFL